jgi:D-aminoacyl-tRNA deacylase
VRAVVQRVSQASVEVDGLLVGSIEAGLLVYLGVGERDSEADASAMAHKIRGLRIFEDDRGKMARSVDDIRGGVLVVSQFTLYGDARRGLRPSFDKAAPPDDARSLYELVVAQLAVDGLVVATGRFAAAMNVSATVAGPVTILLDSQKLF